MKFGVCYYPEHWPEARWPEDARLMREAGLTYVRIAEFAWHLMEPEEGRFTWGWLDRAIETLAAEGLRVILGTPTAAPPVWLAHAHPEILPVDAEGRVRHYGTRRHYCPNSPIYREHTARIVRALAERYGEHPAIVGWQIDNEFGCHDTARCYCRACAQAFRGWLERRYGSLDALNAAWGNIFWGQIYTAWEQIGPPLLTVAEPNPSHALDYWRFSSDQYVAYQQLQLDLLRAVVPPSHFITHNFMGSFTELDYHRLAEPLDFASWDSYPTGYAERSADAFYAPGEPRPAHAYDTGDPYVTGFCHDLVRGMKQAPFWVMEQQTGTINWGRYNPAPRPGTPRLWAWHAALSDADTLIYFRWRAGRYGAEQHHAGLLQHDGSPDVGYGELLALQEELPQLAALSEAPLAVEVALLLDYEDLWALELQPQREGFTALRHLFVFYRALQQLGIPVDIVSPAADLSRYRLVVAPTLFMGGEERTSQLGAYAAQGGTVIMGIRSGFKTPSNLVAGTLPGSLAALIGAEVIAWHALPPGEGYRLITAIPELKGPATVWAEALAPQLGRATVLATYPDGPLAGKAASVSHVVGRGRVLYLGWYPTQAQAQSLLTYLADKIPLRRLAESLPEGLIAGRRGDRTVLINFTEGTLEAQIESQVIAVPARDLVTLIQD